MLNQNTHLSITKRVLLDYIRFRTNNNFIFHEGNEYIAKALDLAPTTAKVFVNDLVREGYLYKATDKQGRRILSYTQKEYVPLFEGMRNVDKKVLKQDRDDALRDNKYLNEQLSATEAHCNQLSSQNTDLVLTNEQLTREVKDLKERLSNLEKRMSAVEKFFIKSGSSKDELEKVIQDNLD